MSSSAAVPAEKSPIRFQILSTMCSGDWREEPCSVPSSRSLPNSSPLGSGADRIVGAIRPGVRRGDAAYAAMT